jgi:rhodanese-related sulfurtransferase
MDRLITREALKGMIDRKEDFILVNTLSPESYEIQHIPGSINIPVEDIEMKAENLLDKEKDIIIYCGSFECTTSTHAAKILDKLGYKNVYDYKGGLQDWKQAGFPLLSCTHSTTVS